MLIKIDKKPQPKPKNITEKNKQKLSFRLPYAHLSKNFLNGSPLK